jgi:hypothetical protein
MQFSNNSILTSSINDLSAGMANQMIVRRMLDKIRIIDLVSEPRSISCNAASTRSVACDKRSRETDDPLHITSSSSNAGRSERRINNRLALTVAAILFPSGTLAAAHALKTFKSI